MPSPHVTARKPAPKQHRHREPKDFGTLGFLPISEVVKRSSLPKDTVWRLIHEDKLHAIRFSSRVWRVHESKLAEWARGLVNGSITPTEGDGEKTTE